MNRTDQLHVARQAIKPALQHLEIQRSSRIGWMRAAVLGANDGIVSTASTHNHKSLARQIAIPWAIQQERAEGRSGGYGRGARRTGRSRGATLRAIQDDHQRRCVA